MDFIKAIFKPVVNFAQAFWTELNRNNDRCIATAVFTTTMVNDDGQPTGRVETHVVKFMVNGYHRRYVSVSTTCEESSKKHSGILVSKENWKIHGEIPSHAARTKQKEVVPLSIVRGDKA